MKKNKNLVKAEIICFILTLIYPLFMVIMAGLGLIYNNYNKFLLLCGIFWIFSGIMISSGTLLCIFNKNILSIINSSTGLLICITILYLVTDYADNSGWTDPYTLNPTSNMYFSRIIPTVFPSLGNILISVIKIWKK